MQWGLDQIKASTAWKRSRGAGVIVAVIDTGVDLQHPDLAGAFVSGLNLIDPKKPPADGESHGTHVAGIIAARQGNGIGIAGVAPLARILPIKALDDYGTGTFADIAPAIDFAWRHGAKVINLSFGSGTMKVLPPSSDQSSAQGTAQAAIDRAWGHGAVIVAAAGNNTLPLCSDPADFTHVLCVGALDRRGLRAYYSQSELSLRPAAFLCAPGGSGAGLWDGFNSDLQPPPEGIISTVPHVYGDGVYTPGYAYKDGTSMAAPHVAGVAALLAAIGLRNDAIVRRLLATARDLGTPGDDPIYGYGEVDAAAALAGLR